MSWFSNIFQNDGYNPREIEDAFSVRVLVFLTVVIAIYATAQAAETPLQMAVLAIVMTGFGSWVSHYRRRAKNWWIKLILALLMLLALANFMSEIADNPYDARLPLAHLLIWLQALHSFDLPRRKDIFYSLWVGLVLISVAATLSRSASFAWPLALFVMAILTSLVRTHLSSHRFAHLSPRLWGQVVLPPVLATLLVSCLIFVVMPRYEGMKVQSFPVSAKFKSLPLFNGEIKNKSYPNQQGKSSAGGNKPNQKKDRTFDPYAYYGFSTELDLNYRGKLSDEIVMRVKTRLPSYWRGMAFDLYDGLNWKMTYPYQLKRVQRSRLPLYIRETQELKRNIVPRSRVVQTFYMERDQSNLIFKAPYAEFLYFPTDYVMKDVYGGLRSPIELLSGTTYSVISEVPQFSAEKLNAITYDDMRENPQDPMYYQVPDNLPQRVRELAKQWIEQTKTPYEAVVAIESQLRTGYPYNLDIPMFPEDRDSIDYFLFEQGEGYCEHFASSLAVMVRTLGLPSRFVTGYTSGKFNPMTGYFDVKSSDAHGWVEVYFPHHGWVPFDPTPGYSANLSESSVYEKQGEHFTRFWAEKIPASWRAGAKKVLAWGVNLLAGLLFLFAKFLGLFSSRQFIAWIAGSIVAILLFVYWRSLKKKAPSEQVFLPRYMSDQDRREWVNAFDALLLEWQERQGGAVQHWSTPLQKIERLRLDSEERANWIALADFYHRIRYSTESVPENQYKTHYNALERLRKSLPEKEEVH